MRRKENKARRDFRRALKKNKMIKVFYYFNPLGIKVTNYFVPTPEGWRWYEKEELPRSSSHDREMWSWEEQRFIPVKGINLIGVFPSNKELIDKFFISHFN